MQGLWYTDIRGHEDLHGRREASLTIVLVVVMYLPASLNCMHATVGVAVQESPMNEQGEGFTQRQRCIPDLGHGDPQRDPKQYACPT